MVCQGAVFVCLIYFAYQGVRDCFATLAMTVKGLAMTGNGSHERERGLAMVGDVLGLFSITLFRRKGDD